jgi:hypothetical protein
MLREEILTDEAADRLWQSLHRDVRSNITGKVIAPDLDDAVFSTAWFAAIEYKSALERQLLSWTEKGSVGTQFSTTRLKKYQRLFVSNTRDNLEDQRFTYETLARLAKLLDEWAERAIELGLI